MDTKENGIFFGIHVPRYIFSSVCLSTSTYVLWYLEKITVVLCKENSDCLYV